MANRDVFRVGYTHSFAEWRVVDLRTSERIDHKETLVALRRFLKSALRYPADALVLSSRALPRRIDERIARSPAFMDNASLSAKFYPYAADTPSFVIRDPVVGERNPSDDGLPVPPPELWEGYGDTLDEYLSGGREDFGNMRSILSSSSFELEGKSVLDFGCSAGRLIRHLFGVVNHGEARGVDISALHIEWCRAHLSPPFRFTTTTTYPHLPFEDNTFDLI